MMADALRVVVSLFLLSGFPLLLLLHFFIEDRKRRKSTDS